MSQEKSIEGLHGWLNLVAIGLILSPIRIGAAIMSTYPPIFSTNTWHILTTPGTVAYNSLWAPVIIGELLINCGVILIWLYLAYLFFTKNRNFPKWYIGMAIFTLVFIIADAFAVKMILPNAPMFSPDTIKHLQQSMIMVAIWVPYMLVSKRVKATFIN